MWFQSPNPCCCRFRWACGKRRAWSQSKWHSRNDVVDHQADVRGEDGINHQPNDPLFHFERRLLESVTDAGAESLSPINKRSTSSRSRRWRSISPNSSRNARPCSGDVHGRPMIMSTWSAGRANRVAAVARTVTCGLAVYSPPTHPHSGRFINPDHVAPAFRLMRRDDSPCSSLEPFFGFTMGT